jgi:hypothetical protein
VAHHVQLTNLRQVQLGTQDLAAQILGFRHVQRGQLMARGASARKLVEKRLGLNASVDCGVLRAEC